MANSTVSGSAQKILIIDDDPLLQTLIGNMAEMLGYGWEAAKSLQEAQQALKQADARNQPFAVVTIDMKFEVGKDGVSMLMGKTILQQIKSQYPQTACIVISGTGLSAHEVLDLRDDYGLDYYITKDRLDKDTLDRGIRRALQRMGLPQPQSIDEPAGAVTPVATPVPPAQRPNRSTVFISYSHQDELEKDRLLSHLGVLGSAELIDLWSDDRIGAGADWESEINEAIFKARVAILLVSVNFLNSKFILQREVPELLKRRQNEGITVFPVIAKACAWKKVGWLARMNVRPKNGRPVWSDGGSHIDEDLAKVAEEVADIVSRKS